MAKHEFGIFEADPEQKASYDSYEPEKYNCIAMDDAYIEPLLEKLSMLNTYSHRLSRPTKGRVCRNNLDTTVNAASIQNNS